MRAPLFEAVADLVESSTGAGFILVAARRAADPKGGDGLLASLDHDRTLRQQHVWNLEDDL